MTGRYDRSRTAYRVAYSIAPNEKADNRTRRVDFQRRAVLRKRRRRAATAFLETVFGASPLDGARILIFTKPGNQSRFFRKAEAAARYAWENRWESEVYVGLALRKRGLSSRRRGGVHDVVALAALGVDIDIAGKAHARAKQYAQTRADALQLVEDLPLPPTFTISSGHGLHLWWVFLEPWRFKGAADRKRAAGLAAGWQATVQAQARKRGFEIDSIGDLARVLRVPGTLNHKLGKRMPVKVLREDKNRRYNRSDFAQFIAEKGPGGSQVDSPLSFTVHPDAEPPLEKLRALLKSLPKFKASWNRSRRDLTDASASGYDLSLASIAFADGWTDQEVVDLIIASRRKHGDDPKLRPDYLQRTLAKARVATGATAGAVTKPNDPWSSAEAAGDFVAHTDPDVDWVEPNLLAPGCITAIFSPRGIGKTLVAHAVALKLARKGKRVLLVDRDNPPPEVRRRLRKFGVEREDLTLRVLTRDQAPPLTNTNTWAQFPAAEYDVVIIDSLDASTEGVGEKDSAKPSRALATILDIAHRPRGPAVLILGNTIKSGAHSRGSGVIEDRADLSFEVRDATGFTPSGKAEWWKELPTGARSQWADQATRRKGRNVFRLAFIVSKCRIASEPAPFVFEIDTSRDPWTLGEVTDQVERSGRDARSHAADEERRTQARAIAALKAEVATRNQSGTPMLLEKDAVPFLMAQRLSREHARQLLRKRDGKSWRLVERRDKPGKPKFLIPHSHGGLR